MSKIYKYIRTVILMASLVLPWMTCTTPAMAITKTVVGEGKTDTCLSRDIALHLAEGSADVNGGDECRNLGKGWRFVKKQFNGYQQCSKCKNDGEFICKVTQAVYVCENTEKEEAEKAAKAKTERDAKAKADQDRIDKERADRDAKAKADKYNADKDKAERESKLKVEKVDQDAKAKIEQEKKDKEKADREARLKAETKKNGQSSANNNDCGARSASAQSSNMLDSLDDMAAKPAIAKQLAEERANYRQTAVNKCNPIMSEIHSCYEKRQCNIRVGSQVDACISKMCGPKPSTTLETCLRRGSPCRPDQPPNTYCLGLGPCLESEVIPNANYPKWDACSASASQCRTDTSCVNSCNPNGYSNLDACVSAVMSREGPSESSVREKYNKKWEQKSSSVGCKSGSDKQSNGRGYSGGKGSVSNFLDN